MLDTLWADVRFAWRMLRKSPGFTAVAVGTLGLGIGANTAIFSVVDHAILRPLEYRQPERLFAVQEAVPNVPGMPPVLPVNAMHFLEWRKTGRALEAVALLDGYSPTLTGTGEPQRVEGARVSWNLFQMLGVQPVIGRNFRAEEDQPGHDGEVIINSEFWRSRLGSDPHVLGRKIVLNGRPYEVIGVLPANFRFPKLSQLFSMNLAGERPEIWKPFALRDEELDDMGDFNFACIARLKPGVSSGEALAQLNAIQAGFARKLPEKLDLRAMLYPLRGQIVAQSRAGLEMVLMAVGAVLLIACVNIANLLLARSTVRRREMAIRTALGASTGRLLRQVLVESLALALAGGVVGCGIAYAAIQVVVSRAPVDLPRLDEVQLDARVLLFTAAISVVCGLLFGLLPAWASSRQDPQDAMKAAGRGSTAGAASGRLRSMLVGVEVCLSTMALLAGALLLHSFANLLSVEKGFAVEHIATVDLSLPGVRYPDANSRALFIKRMLERVEALPGITSAAIVNRLPLSGEGGNNVIQVEGSTIPLMQRPILDIRQMSPDYFRTMGIPLRRGRAFANTNDKRLEAVVSEGAARRLWPNEDPVGKRFRIGDERNPLMRVVGVAGDIRGASLNAAPTIVMYVPYWVQLWGAPNLVVKTDLPVAVVASEVRKAVQEMDSQIPVQKFQTMEEVLEESVSQRKFQMDLVLLFGVSALLLASLGIYGVVSYAVAQRTNEIGIRMTLGAGRGDVSRIVLREGLQPVIAGLMGGVVLSLAAGRLMISMLFGVTAEDPLAMSAVVLALLAVAVIATLVPARRAARIDPAVALRYE